MHSKRIAAALTGALVPLLMAGPALADDDTVLTSGSPAGTAVPAGDTIAAGITTGSQAVFATAPGGANGMRCDASSLSAAVVDNPVAPGAASLSATLGLSACTVTGVPG